MSEAELNLKRLKEPFLPTDIEWRVGRSGVKRNGEIWAQVLAYVTNRAIMDRLDEVCGEGNWYNEYKPGPSGGLLCGIAIRVGGEWVIKWDGAENTDIEPVKGGLSNSMKRAAVQWGIGRYLYDLPDGWADVVEKGTHKDCVKAKNHPKKVDEWFEWNPPKLPNWALPTGATKEPSKTQASEPAEKPANGEKPKSNGTGKPAASTSSNGSKDPFKEWEAKIVAGKAPAQLRAMKNGIARAANEGKLTDEQRCRLQEMAETFAQRLERAIETAGAPGG